MEPKQKVKFKINATAKKPVNAVAAAPVRMRRAAKRGKSFINHFQGNFLNGSALKVTSSQTERVVRDNPGKVRIRRLGPVLEEIPGESPSVLIEVDSEGDLMKELKDLRSRTIGLEGTVLGLQGKLDKLEEFHSDALEMAVRAFLDKVLESFYRHAGKGALNFVDRARWLNSEEAQDFVKKKSLMPLFGNGLLVSGRLLKLLKSMKVESSIISGRNAHSTKPYRVAIALQDLDGYKSKVDYHWIFQKAFGMTPEVMVSTWAAGQLDNHNSARFGLDK